MNIRAPLFWGSGVAAAAAALLAVTVVAQAQAPKAPDKTAPAATKTTKPPSPCKGLDETACKAKDECTWITPKTGKQKPYCRLKSKTTKKKAAPSATPPSKDATPKK